jgi:predicted phage tail protein
LVKIRPDSVRNCPASGGGSDAARLKPELIAHAAGLGAVVQFIYGAVIIHLSFGVGGGVTAITAGIEFLGFIIATLAALGTFVVFDGFSFCHNILL